MASEDLHVGQAVELSDGRPAVIRFVGATDFAPTGIWVGVELDDYSGKNDGSVKGERYFDCEENRGMFVRPAAVAPLEVQPIPIQAPAAARANGLVRKSRPSSVVPASKRMSSVPDTMAARRASMNASSPSPAVRRPSSIRSPTKSPTKQLLSAGSSVTSTPRTGTPSNPNSRAPSVTATRTRPISTTRTSMGPPAIPASRNAKPAPASAVTRLSSVASRPSLAPKAAGRPVAGRISSVSSQVSHASTAAQSETSGKSEEEAKIPSPTASDTSNGPSPKAVSPLVTRTVSSGRPTTQSATSSQGTSSPGAQRSTAASREIEELKTKLRVMEKKRMEDRDKLKVLDKVQADRDKFEAIIGKLQTKYQPQQQEITNLRKQLKESTVRFEEIEDLQAEHDVVLEMATLDREMAEEQAEVLKTELEALKMRAEELELEVEVLREENEELGGEMSAEEKTSQGWLQMERNNERLRDALLRLRDMTQQTEAELKSEIKALETDNKDLALVKEHHETAKERLALSEASVEDLRQQLDNALGAEDMIEELTERNMSMSEQIEELKVTIEDLESLKEVNDELEINHVETEKDMQEEIDIKDAIIFEQARRAAEKDNHLDDMEYTLSRFRELVTNLQTDLEDMRASHAVTETEAEKLNSSSRAMLDLNMKLQASAAKTQAKTIDLELRKLEAQEASDHLEIVQLFLPDAFQSDKDSILALLRFKRVAFKANLLHGFLKEKISGQATRGHEDDIFAACDVLDKLAWISAMCDRFSNAIIHCSVEQFAKYEGSLYELEPVERALNGYIDALRRDELKEKQCATELQRTIALMTHLAEVHIADGLESYADDIHMRAVLMHSHLENTAAALSMVKVMVTTTVPGRGEEDEMQLQFTKKIEAITTATRSAKVIIGKAVRSLEEMKTRSLSLLPETIEQFEQCQKSTEELATFSRQTGIDLFGLLHDDQVRSESFTYHEVASSVNRTTSGIFEGSSDSEVFSTFGNKIRNLTTTLTDLSSLAGDLSQTQEFERAQAPWLLRSRELKSTRTVAVDTEEELHKLKDDIRERSRLIAVRDQTLEEAGVKIELLESRMKDAGKKNERIAELEKLIEAAQKREAELGQAMEARDKELMSSEQEREKWKKVAGEQKVVEVDAGSKEGMEKAVATRREMESLKEEIEALQAAVRYLREDNRLTKLNEPKNTRWLEEPLIRKKSAKEQKRDLVAREGNDVLNELLTLTMGAELFDFNTLPQDRLAWRPKKLNPGYHVARQRENWQAWKGWSSEVVAKAEGVLKPRSATAGVARKRGGGGLASWTQARLPELNGKGGQGGEVRIVGDNGWNGDAALEHGGREIPV